MAYNQSSRNNNKDIFHPYWEENFRHGERYEHNEENKTKPKKGSPWLKIPINLFLDFCKETSIHGFNHIVALNRHPLEKLLWLAMTVLAGLGAFSLCMEQWTRFQANPVVVALEKDYRNWNNSFMALTTCQQYKWLNESMEHYVEHNWGAKKDDKKYQYRYYVDFVKMVTNASLIYLDGFIPYKDDPTLQEIDLFDLATRVAIPLQHSVAWFDKTLNVSFVNVMTERGVCHTINSIVSIDQAINIPQALNPKPINDIVRCNYFTTPCYMRLEFNELTTTVYYHSPYEIFDIQTNIASHLTSGVDADTDWIITETKASKDIKDLGISRRKCRFHDEPMSEEYKVYSNDICRRQCRARLSVKLCGCRPYFYFQEGYKPCGVAGMACLSQYSQKIIQQHDCVCFPQCVDAHYRLTNKKSRDWGGPFRYRAAIKIGILSPRTRYTRQILFCFEDLVVSFGGAAGLFLGCSFLSAIEIVYFILSKLSLALFRCNKKTQTQTDPTYNIRQKNVIRMDNIQQTSHYNLGKFISETATLDK